MRPRCIGLNYCALSFVRTVHDLRCKGISKRFFIGLKQSLCIYSCDIVRHDVVTILLSRYERQLDFLCNQTSNVDQAAFAALETVRTPQKISHFPCDLPRRGK